MIEASELSRRLAEVAGRVAFNDLGGARERASADLPFVPRQRRARALTKREMTSVMLRDGFIDRYKGTRIWHPGALRLLSDLMPDLIPWHPSWKLDACHGIYWELSPSIDHIVPLTRGGADDEANLITTSWASNIQKSNMYLDQLGWSQHPPGVLTDWDGYLGWFLTQMDQEPQHRQQSYLRDWERAARTALADRQLDPYGLPSSGASDGR